MAKTKSPITSGAVFSSQKWADLTPGTFKYSYTTFISGAAWNPRDKWSQELYDKAKEEMEKRGEDPKKMLLP